MKAMFRGFTEAFPDMHFAIDHMIAEGDRGGVRCTVTGCASPPSADVGKAVIAHIKETMKDEEPKLLCYEPKDARTIAVQPKK